MAEANTQDISELLKPLQLKILDLEKSLKELQDDKRKTTDYATRTDLEDRIKALKSELAETKAEAKAVVKESKLEEGGEDLTSDFLL